MIYEPSDDSYLLKKEVSKFCKGKTVLDVGSGSGIQAESAIEFGAKEVLAIDIDSEAVKLLTKKGISALKSDLLSNVKGKFDLIIFNPPYLPLDKMEDRESSRITSGGEAGDEIILRFLKEAKKSLSAKGIILIVLSSLTPKSRIIKRLKELDLKKEVIAEKKLFMEKLEVWKIEAKV
ncbi:MAG: methyltransferase [Nanoarchaeota archaeon]|nr:methyltransferase [Nanoarchaeota archaeon]